MIKIICGEKGNGKTKEMLQRAEEVISNAGGDVIYVDKNSKHMYELNNKIRLVDITEYPVQSYDGFVGFVSGLLSGNHDIETVFFDSLLTISKSDGTTLPTLLNTLEKLSDGITFILSISLPETELPEAAKEKVIVSL
ncbi:MAG: twitching motility protein PilT [Eubacterium sp.]|nr:twitching motility protein PilT [Eubacterium sp.]